MDKGPDPRWADSQPRLVELIRDEILAAPGRRISFARFMQRALTEPGLGYYASSVERPTRGGDFLTAPELHPFFGRCLGRHIERAWRALGRPDTFAVREWGAGRGALETAVRDGLRADDSALTDRLSWQPVDLAGRHPQPPDAAITGMIVANEFLDALPVHRVGLLAGRLVEFLVTWREGWFVEEPGEPSTPALAAHLEADGVRLAEGQRAEICLATAGWLAAAAADLERGWLLVIDYGHPAAALYGPARMAGTLMTYRHHRAGRDPFVAVGHGDITAHVDLTALERAASGAGLLAAGQSSQAELLVELGLGDLLSELGGQPETDPQTYLEARASVARLIDPRHLGGFRVLRWSRGVPAAVAAAAPA